MKPSKSQSRLKPVFAEVFDTIQERKRAMPDNSYVASLLRVGPNAILCKVMEEAGEVVKAIREQKKDQQVYELCDLFFHTMVLMAAQDISLEEVEQELARRHGISGLEEKTARKKG